MDNLIIENGKILNTDLAFEYSSIDVEVNTIIESVKNPISGKIRAREIRTLILDDEQVNPKHTEYVLEVIGELYGV
ncbi:hypothetical protein D3C77_608300 [compost metagenome]